MIENTCLAILVALREGVEEEIVLERLATWKPTSQRGELIERGGRKIYADHYNANPASFADAAEYFHRKFPSGPRIWVIGGMEELGVESSSWHRRLAAELPILAEDRIFLVGERAAEMGESLAEKVEKADQVRTARAVEEILTEIEELPGVLFLKGSRKYRLEKVLDSLGSAG